MGRRSLVTVRLISDCFHAQRIKEPDRADRDGKTPSKEKAKSLESRGFAPVIDTPLIGAGQRTERT
jgi:hypothetical protein